MEIVLIENPVNFVSKYSHPYATTLARRCLKIGLGDWKFEEDALIIFGGESGGIPREISRKHEIKRVTIPNFGPECCLSLPIAYGIFMYEFLRQNPSLFPKRIKEK